MRLSLCLTLSVVIAGGAACERRAATVRDEVAPTASSTPPRSRGCADVPTSADLRTCSSAHRPRTATPAG